MARQQTSDFLEIIQAAVDGLVKRLAAEVVAAAEELAKQKVRARKTAPARGRRPGAARSPRPAEITAWTTDRRARRVPNFVIEMTGLDTKKKIVAKFGENVTFRRGQALPPAKATPASGAQSIGVRNPSAAGQSASSVAAKGRRTRKVKAAIQAPPPVVAKPPRVRKASAA